MPLIGATPHEEQNTVAGSNFGYSAATIDHLEQVGTSEYTLATIVVDVSSSVASYKNEMEKALQACFDSWRKHPRSDYLLVRLITFANDVAEIHGFRLLADCDPAQYVGILNPRGMTALYKGGVNAIRATRDYAEKLVRRSFLVNAITTVITDGMDNKSGTVQATDVATELTAAMNSEFLESHVGILIGVGVGGYSDVRTFLRKFEVDTGFSQYVELADASPQTLAKLGNFMASSVSSQSTHLGTGGPSKPLSF